MIAQLTKINLVPGLVLHHYVTWFVSPNVHPKTENKPETTHVFPRFETATCN